MGSVFGLDVWFVFVGGVVNGVLIAIITPNSPVCWVMLGSVPGWGGREMGCCCNDTPVGSRGDDKKMSDVWL